jgi:hypothetical protein
MSLTATDAAGNTTSKPRTITFTVVRARETKS